MTIEEMISAVQRKLGVQDDGRAGPETWGAIYARIVEVNNVVGAEPAAIDIVDARSEKVIATLLPEVQPLARALIQKAAIAGIKIKIISGLRSFAEQNELYAQGRDKPGKIVTKARGGYSNHNFGLAFDIGVFEGANYLQESVKYKAVGAIGLDIGLEWGGNWKTVVDQPHFQLRPAWALDLGERDMLAELRQRTANGVSAFA